MSGLPDTTFAGTVVADPELRFTPNGDPVCNFTVACNKRVFNKDTGEWEDRDATFLRCTIWRQPAENIAETVIKGTRVMVQGEIKQRSFETKEGEKRSVFEVDAFEVGVSLKYAVAKVSKATRSGGGNTSAGDAGDPWGSAPPAGGGSFSDEPPF